MNTAALELVLKAADCHIASERVRLDIEQFKKSCDLTEVQKEGQSDLATLETAMWMMRNTLAKELQNG